MNKQIIYGKFNRHLWIVTRNFKLNLFGTARQLPEAVKSSFSKSFDYSFDKL